MVKYALEQRIFLCDNYVKKKSYSVKEGFTIGILVFVSQLYQRFSDSWKVRSTGSFLDKKYTRQNAVLTEETLDEIGARLEHSLANPWHD
jgi:hypothetical protein